MISFMGKIMLIGDKTVAFFDIWSIEHLMVGIILTFILNKTFPNKKVNLILLLLLISGFWECSEHYLEEGLLGPKIQDWFAGIEHWGNRLIGDNLVMAMGYLIYNKYPKSIYLAGIFSFVFFLFHLCCPSSMDIQNILF